MPLTLRPTDHPTLHGPLAIFLYVPMSNHPVTMIIGTTMACLFFFPIKSEQHDLNRFWPIPSKQRPAAIINSYFLSPRSKIRAAVQLSHECLYSMFSHWITPKLHVFLDLLADELERVVQEEKFPLFVAMTRLHLVLRRQSECLFLVISKIFAVF